MRRVTGFFVAFIMIAGLSACQNKPIVSDSVAGKIKPPAVFCGVSGLTNIVETTAALSVRVYNTNFSIFMIEFTNLSYKPLPELTDKFIISGNRFILKDKDLITTNSVFYFYFTSFYSQKSGIGVRLTDVNGNEIAVTNYTLYWLNKTWNSNQAFGIVVDQAELRVGYDSAVEYLGAANSLPVTAYLQTGYPTAAYVDAALIAENVSNSNQTVLAEFNYLKILGNRAQFGWSMTNGGLDIGNYYLYMKFHVLDGYYSEIGDYGMYWKDKQCVLAVTNLYVPIEPEPEAVTQAVMAVESLMMVGKNGEVVTVRENEYPKLTALLKTSLPGAASADAKVILESLADGKQTKVTQFTALPMIENRAVFYWTFIPKNIAIGGYYIMLDYNIYDGGGKKLTNFNSYWNNKLSHCKVLWVMPAPKPVSKPEPKTNPAPVKKEKHAITGLKIVLNVEDNAWIIDLSQKKSIKVNTLLEIGTNAAYANLSLIVVKKSSGVEIPAASIDGLEFFDGRIQYGWNLLSSQVKEKGEFYILVRYELLNAEMKLIRKIEKYWNEKSSIIIN
jgi:hypothetical protein